MLGYNALLFIFRLPNMFRLRCRGNHRCACRFRHRRRNPSSRTRGLRHEWWSLGSRGARPSAWVAEPEQPELRVLVQMVGSQQMRQETEAEMLESPPTALA